VSLAIHDSSCWDRRTLKRVARHRKKLGRLRENFSKRLRPRSRVGATFIKFCGKMTHFWQGRSGRSPRARGVAPYVLDYDLVVPALAIASFARQGWRAPSFGAHRIAQP